MARHRNVRKLDFEDEYEYDDTYGRSFEDESAVSPNTAAQFLYPRESRETPSLLSYIDTPAGGPTINRSVPEPYQLQFKSSKEITCTSSLSSTSGTVTTIEGVSTGAPPGFKPLAVESKHSARISIEGHCKTSPTFLHVPRVHQSQSCAFMPKADTVSSYDATEKIGAYPQKPSYPGDGSHPPSSLSDLYLCSSANKPEESPLHEVKIDKKNGNQDEQATLIPQKSLLDIVTENTAKYSSCEVVKVKKKGVHLSVPKLMHGAKVSDVSKPRPMSVCKQSLSLAQIIQHEQETLHCTSFEPVFDQCVYTACDTGQIVMANTCIPDTPTRDIDDSKLNDMTQNAMENFRSDLSQWSQSIGASSRFVDQAQKYKKLSVRINHQQPISRSANVTQIPGVQCLDSLTTISVERSEFSDYSCTLKDKSDVEFQYGNVAESMEGKFFLSTVVVSREIKRSLSYSLLRYRKFVIDKLREEYAQTSFLNFDFSTQSPDDIVHEKQCGAFLQH